MQQPAALIIDLETDQFAGIGARVRPSTVREGRFKVGFCVDVRGKGVVTPGGVVPFPSPEEGEPTVALLAPEFRLEMN